VAPGGKVGGNVLTHGSCGRTQRIRVLSACRLHVRDLFAKGENGVAVATAPIHGLSFLNVCRAQRSITLDTQATRGDARCPLPSELNPRVTGLPSEPRRVRPATRRAGRRSGCQPLVSQSAAVGDDAACSIDPDRITDPDLAVLVGAHGPYASCHGLAPRA